MRILPLLLTSLVACSTILDAAPTLVTGKSLVANPGKMVNKDVQVLCDIRRIGPRIWDDPALADYHELEFRFIDGTSSTNRIMPRPLMVVLKSKSDAHVKLLRLEAADTGSTDYHIVTMKIRRLELHQFQTVKYTGYVGLVTDVSTTAATSLNHARLHQIHILPVRDLQKIQHPMQQTSRL